MLFFFYMLFAKTIFACIHLYVDCRRRELSLFLQPNKPQRLLYVINMLQEPSDVAAIERAPAAAAVRRCVAAVATRC